MIPPKIIETKEPEKKKEEIKKELPPKIAGRSQLKKLASRLEMGSK